MKIQNIIGNIFYMIFFIGIQILIFRNMALFDLGFCFFYVGFILLIPQEYPILFTLILAFITGFIVDLFYDTMGIHMASCVLIGYIRPYIIQFFTPRGGYDANANISVSYMGAQWFVTYAATLILIHHFTLFVIESWGFGLILRMLSKTLLSSLFTLLVVVLFQYLITPAKKQ